jgi:integrase
MATIQKMNRKKGVGYRVIIRKKGINPISKIFSTKKLAVQFANKLEGDSEYLIAYGQKSVVQMMHLSKLFDDYLLNAYTGKYPKDQRSKFNFWLKSIGNKTIDSITIVDITKVLSHLSDTKSNATVNRFKAAISVVFNYACRQYNLTSNPVGLIPSKPEDNHRVRYLSTLERKSLLRACGKANWPKLYLLVLMAITTGARRGELLGLRWNDIDFERQTAYVQTTKNGQPKVLPLTDDVVNELTRFRQQDASLIFNSEVNPSNAFCFNEQWKKALALAEVDNFRFHDLRHTTASYLAMSGASLLEIADVLGHKQISVTQRYAHLCIDHKEKLISKVFSEL